MTFEGGVTLGRHVRFDLAPGARLVIAGGVTLDDRCRFHLAPGAEVRIGAGTRLGACCAISSHAAVTIGDRCLLGDEVAVVDFDLRHEDVEMPVRAQGVRAAAIVIGDDVHIGPAAVVQRGVRVAPGARVDAKAVVAATS